LRQVDFDESISSNLNEHFELLEIKLKHKEYSQKGFPPEVFYVCAVPAGVVLFSGSRYTFIRPFERKRI